MHTNKQILYHYANHIISYHIISYHIKCNIDKSTARHSYTNINNKWQVTIKKIIWFSEWHKWETSFDFLRNLHLSMKYWMLNVEITYYPYIILIIYQQSSHLISSCFISSHQYPSYNVHPTHWSLYRNMHIQRSSCTYIVLFFDIRSAV